MFSLKNLARKGLIMACRLCDCSNCIMKYFRGNETGRMIAIE